jgi:hypothetical protein
MSALVSSSLVGVQSVRRGRALLDQSGSRTGSSGLGLVATLAVSTRELFVSLCMDSLGRHVLSLAFSVNGGSRRLGETMADLKRSLPGLPMGIFSAPDRCANIPEALLNAPEKLSLVA